tara:strand:+ start:301 stop:534 length:234 start_codon:yes stop_codon:yes gene_type:complete
MTAVNKLSRGPSIDTEKCVELAGGNRFNLILIAAARAREIARKHKFDERQDCPHSTVSALLDVQSGAVGVEYLLKVK